VNNCEQSRNLRISVAQVENLSGHFSAKKVEQNQRLSLVLPVSILTQISG
jgi:hypothetical protein